MIQIQKSFPLPDFAASCADPETLYFDIETTGLSAHDSCLYLIGCCYYDGAALQLIQWFSESFEDEQNLLRAFSEKLRSFSRLAHFNGTGFDIPYLRTCARQYHLSIPFSDVESLDLFPIARRHKTLFQLPNCKQKSVERFFHLGREDAYSGGELIEQYEAYLATGNETLYQNLLLHNEEDVRNLPLLHACLNAYEISVPEALHTEMVSSPVGISLVLTLPQTIPVPVQLETSCGTLLLQDRLCTLSFPFYAGELRLFYPNYKDYYYLPEEDYAIHQKVAQFVDKSHRKKATAATCYTRHSGYFLPLPGAVTEPVFQMTPKKGPWYVLYAKELVSPDELSEKEYSRVRDALLAAADVLLSDCNLTVKK